MGHDQAMDCAKVRYKEMKIPFLDISRQNRIVKEDVRRAIDDIFEKNSFIGGDYVKNLECDMASYLGVKSVITCGNGTDALVLALRACGIGEGDEVITTPFSFFATAEAIAYVGAKPVFVDIRESDYLIDPVLIEGAITDRTKAILPVHIFGAPCDMDSINGVAKNHGLVVIEDAAQAIGAKYKERYTGNLSDIGCFSFYPTKNLGGCGDGGMVTTNNDNLSTILSAIHEHGAGKTGAAAKQMIDGASDVSKESDVCIGENTSENYDPYKYYNYLIGCNSRLDAIQAAILGVKLNHLEEFNRQRELIAARYDRELCNAVKKTRYSIDIRSCRHQYAICTEKKFKLCEFLSENGIGAGTFYPVRLHLQKAFDYLGYHEGDLPVAEKVCSESVCLPIFPGMMEDEVSEVIECVNGYFEKRA